MTKKDKSSVHPELKTDTEKFLVVNKAFQFIKKYATSLESPENQFQAYFKKINLTEEFVKEVIAENFEAEIEEKLHSSVGKLHPLDIMSEDYFFDGQLTSYGCEILDCEDIEHEIINDTALVSGIVYASCEVEILEYNSVRDPGEDRYSSAGEKTVTYKLHFNFDLKKDEMYSDLEITDSKIYEVI